uniref:HNH nuclease domain-containing protein n=1 Tax=Mycena chlorophos TaxID=658473 RepID=A0ABQ0LI63_MYCCL|nr:predicted protein [Mycena chlorophos]
MPQLELRILRHVFNGSPPPPPPDAIALPTPSASTLQLPPPTSTEAFLPLLNGPLNHFEFYAGEERASWLVGIVHDICDPVSKTGILRVWTEDKWRSVSHSEDLVPSVYVYDVPDGRTVSLSQYCEYWGRSETSTVLRHAAKLRAQTRDGRCWITRAVGPCRNSRIFPKRMGDALARQIYAIFCGSLAPPMLSIEDERCTITLQVNMHEFFRRHELGLRLVDSSGSPPQYRVHSFLPQEFDPERWSVTLGGVVRSQPRPAPYGSAANLPRLHGYSASPPSQDEGTAPPGMLQWHYLQCVLKMFGTESYRDLVTMVFPPHPMRIWADSESSDDELDEDWPSAPLDLARMAQQEEQVKREQIDWWIGEI